MALGFIKKNFSFGKTEEEAAKPAEEQEVLQPAEPDVPAPQPAEVPAEPAPEPIAPEVPAEPEVVPPQLASLLA